MKAVITGLGLALALAASLPAVALELPRPDPVPGGIALLPLVESRADQRPRVEYEGHPVMVLPSQDTPYADQAPWVAVVGIPLAKAAGPADLQVEGRPLRFEVAPKQYREQRITVKNKRHVNPNALDMERILREKEEILAALAAWSTPETVVTRLEKPAQGPYSSPFGLRRFFNDQPRKPHSGLDIAAPRGAPITAPAPGRVVATGDYFFNGRTVILDHGWGLTTMYSHMERIEVTLGERVETGEPLGTVGSSGRVTGPHLHWSVSLNDARVNPRLLLAE